MGDPEEVKKDEPIKEVEAAPAPEADAPQPEVKDEPPAEGEHPTAA